MQTTAKQQRRVQKPFFRGFVCVIVMVVLCACTVNVEQIQLKLPPTPLPAPTPRRPALPEGPCATVAAHTLVDRSKMLATSGGTSAAIQLTSFAGDHQPAASDRAAIAYNAETNTIMLGKGAKVGLAGVRDVVKQPELLREVAPGEWLLGANIQIEAGARLRIAAPEVRWLKLRSDTHTFVWIKALGGQLDITKTCLSSWDELHAGYDENYGDGRSFVLARDGARMNIRNAELNYLGYDSYESYGVAWRMPGTSGEALNSHFGNNFYGLYLHNASDITIRGNEVHHSVRYGIDPHTSANRLLIEGNVSHDNGKHGIILAETCNESIIRDNIVYANKLHGIVLFDRSNDNVVEHNVAYGNALQGINVNNSSGNTIRENTVYDNVEAGIGVGQAATDNRIISNVVYANHQDGITLYSEAAQNVLRGNVVRDNTRYGIYVKSKQNTIDVDNEVFGNTIGVYLNTDQPPEVSRQTNRIHDNREADVRTGAD